jgi:hypothetical protein
MRILATVGEQSVCHLSYADNLGWKALLIKVKDPLYKRLLLKRAHLEVDKRCLAFREDTSKAST